MASIMIPYFKPNYEVIKPKPYAPFIYPCGLYTSDNNNALFFPV